MSCNTLHAWCHPAVALRSLAALGLALLAACGGGSSDANSAAVPADVRTADVRVLMMGNSHTETGDLPQQLATLLGQGLAGRRVATWVAPGSMFLDERLAHAPSLEVLRNERWTVVVLQAQKYSSTGLFTYSTTEAQALIRMARASGAQPVLFPEWSRRGVDETARIHELHLGIARQEPACVAPMGQAWDLAATRVPGVALHDSDGNHATVAGAYLSALVLYGTLTGLSPLGLAPLNNGVDPTLQVQLRQAAADALLRHPARALCPADRALGLPP
jgi:hypothetical protein